MVANDKTLLENLVSISKSIGKNSMYVQGGGGNTSVKMNDGVMAIKSSGIALKDIDVNNGYSLINYKLVKEITNNNKVTENEFDDKIKGFILNDKKPSMEYGFHSLLNSYVIHTHSVFVNVLTCSKEGKTLLKNLFKDSVWIDYVTPGFDLTMAIKNSILNIYDPQIIFLQNHGLIVSNNSKDETLNLHNFVNETIKDYLKISENDFDTVKDIENSDYNIFNDILFPDQIIYTSNKDDKLKSTLAYKETVLAYNFILINILNHNLTPHFIDKAKAKLLLEMESEKYRQSLLKK